MENNIEKYIKFIPGDLENGKAYFRSALHNSLKAIKVGLLNSFETSDFSISLLREVLVDSYGGVEKVEKYRISFELGELRVEYNPITGNSKIMKD